MVLNNVVGTIPMFESGIRLGASVIRSTKKNNGHQLSQLGFSPDTSNPAMQILKFDIAFHNVLVPDNSYSHHMDH